MSSKLLALFGLSEGGAGDESHSRRRTDYMKKFQRLVVPEEGDEEGEPPENIVTAPDDGDADGEPDPTPGGPGGEIDESAGAVEPDDEGDVQPEEGDRRGRHDRPGKSGKPRFFGFGEALRRPKDDRRLILVRTGAGDMIDDIEEALFSGRNVLLDFSGEDRETARRAVTKLVNYARAHNGAFYALTGTSMLLSMDRDAVVEWRPESGE